MVNRGKGLDGRRFGRRETIGLLGMGSLLVIGGRRASACLSGFDYRALACVASPSEIEGPFFVDEKLERSDIRSDPSTGRLSEGAPFRLKIGVHRIAAGSCAPWPGAQVDVWHCDSRGLYSDERALGDAGTKFLRGYQMTDAKGRVEFLTIFPGWYPGRAVHFHVKVRTPPRSGKASSFTTQLYLDDALIDRVHGTAPYNRRPRRDTTNDLDQFFTGPSEDGAVAANNGARLLLTTTEDGRGGYAGTIDLGLLA